MNELNDELEVIRFVIAREDLQVAVEAVLRPYLYADAVERAASEVLDLLR